MATTAKHGFERAIVPKANAPKKSIPGFEVIGVTRLHEVLSVLKGRASPEYSIRRGLISLAITRLS